MYINQAFLISVFGVTDIMHGAQVRCGDLRGRVVKSADISLAHLTIRSFFFFFFFFFFFYTKIYI